MLPSATTDNPAPCKRRSYSRRSAAKSVYRFELVTRLQGLDHELEHGKHGQPEIKGYTKEYLEASSPRCEQIKDHFREVRLKMDGGRDVQLYTMTARSCPKH